MIQKIKKHMGIRVLFLLLFLFTAGVSVQASTPNVVTSATAVSGGKWIVSGTQYKYKYSNGEYAVKKWHRINDALYYFDENGYRKTGLFTVNTYLYGAKTNGQVYYSKRVLINNNYYYYFQSNGIAAMKKWVKFGTKFYYFNSAGKMLKNSLVLYNKHYYYVNADGVKVTSTWVLYKGKKYYFGSDGIRIQNTWIKSGSFYLYLQADGTIAKNRWVGNYYVDGKGHRKCDCIVDGYYLNSAGKRTIKAFTGKYMFVGDSRTVGMEAAVPRTDTFYIGKVSMGVDWLENTVGPNLYYYMKANPDMTVIFAMGVNDLGNINRYITYYKKVLEKFPKAKVRFLSVNPVVEKAAQANGMYVKNAKIEEFNTILKATFPTRYIDTYTQMKKIGFKTQDGVHYAATTYQWIYQYVIGKIS